MTDWVDTFIPQSSEAAEATHAILGLMQYQNEKSTTEVILCGYKGMYMVHTIRSDGF